MIDLSEMEIPVTRRQLSLLLGANYVDTDVATLAIGLLDVLEGELRALSVLAHAGDFDLESPLCRLMERVGGACEVLQTVHHAEQKEQTS